MNSRITRGCKSSFVSMQVRFSYLHYTCTADIVHGVDVGDENDTLTLAKGRQKGRDRTLEKIIRRHYLVH